tara:strand:+ start:524 stop:775 length:252 start_codon:yes stop_codon:yes gene_type:complete
MNLIKNSKLLIVLLSVLLVSLSGCGSNSKRVDCDSGFTTGVSQHAYSDEGVVYWRKNAGDLYNSRVMSKGEICLQVMVERKAN